MQHTHNNPVITRFAPSPTGKLHLGVVRTALFNYLFAKKYNGKFLLRIEDTDHKRSNTNPDEYILKPLKQLGLSPDDVFFQSHNQKRYIEVIDQLLHSGAAYHCYSSQEEINDLRQKAINDKQHFIFKSPWRDSPNQKIPSDVKPVVRIKAPRTGQTIVNDLLQGKIVIENSHLDDMILLRSDNTPTYMLAVVVDDHDMNISHIIRGDDHLNNASRQQIIYNALDWPIPEMVHIPLLHAPDGPKLSKRYSAMGIEEYINIGYLPEAINNYLLRLGWSHGNDEIISMDDAIKWFNIESMSKSPARLDFDKFKYINAHYLRDKSDEELLDIITSNLLDLSDESKNYIKLGIELIKPRISLIPELCELAKIFVIDCKLQYNQEAQEIIANINLPLILKTLDALENLEQFDDTNHIKTALKTVAEENNIKLSEIMKSLRPLITGHVHSPSVFQIMSILGKKHIINRLKIGLKKSDSPTVLSSDLPKL